MAALQAPALVALRRLGSQPQHFAAVVAAVGIPGCLNLLESGNSRAVHAAVAALLTTLAAGDEAQNQAIVALGGAPLLLSRLLGGTTEGQIWSPSHPNSEQYDPRLEFAAARALHALSSAAPDAGLWHAGLFRTVGCLDPHEDAGVQWQALSSVFNLLKPSSQGNALKVLLDLDLAHSIKQLVLARAGAIVRLLGLLRDSSNSNFRDLAAAALGLCAYINESQPFRGRLAAEFVSAGATPAMVSLMHDHSCTDWHRFYLATSLESLSRHGIV